MACNIRVLVPVIVLLAFSPASIAFGPVWENRLQDGSRIQVDPATNRIMVFSRRGVATPLWDGVHRLADGSSITVRSGIMVPNTEVLERRQLPQRGVRKPGVQETYSPCRQLVRKVCGLHDECADHPVCGPAKQLLRAQQEEVPEADPSALADPGALTVRQCEEALRDEEFFVACGEERPRRAIVTSCRRLRDKVCGAENQCGSQPACPPARQLLELENTERNGAPDPDAPTRSSIQCVEALRDEQFFTPCAP